VTLTWRKRGKHHEEVEGPIALVLVVETSRSHPMASRHFWMPCASSCGSSPMGLSRSISLSFAIRRRTRYHISGLVAYRPALEALLGPRRAPADPLEERHRDIARSVEAMYEEAFFHLIGRLHERHALADLAVAGGCAMNSVANGKVRRVTPFRRVYVQSAAGDAGGAIGAAFALWQGLGGARSFVMDHAYWGPRPHSMRPWNQPTTFPSAVAVAARRHNSASSAIVSTEQPAALISGSLAVLAESRSLIRVIHDEL
jgi:predicted NodU family carbamoyl transferase